MRKTEPEPGKVRQYFVFTSHFSSFRQCVPKLIIACLGRCCYCHYCVLLFFSSFCSFREEEKKMKRGRKSIACREPNKSTHTMFSGHFDCCPDFDLIHFQINIIACTYCLCMEETRKKNKKRKKKREMELNKPKGHCSK